MGSLEEARQRSDGQLLMFVMVGWTLSHLTANYYAPCKHRVLAPPPGCRRVGLPFLVRGRNDAVVDTRPTREACTKAGRMAHLAEIPGVATIAELLSTAGRGLVNWQWVSNSSAQIVPGMLVKLHSLQARPEFNGCEGICETFNADSQRWSVRVSPSLIVSIKPLNLVP